MGWNWNRCYSANASHADIAGFIDAGLNREHARKVDFAHLSIATLNLAPDLQLVVVKNLDGVHERGERVIEHGREHSSDLRRPILSLNAGKDEVILAFRHERLKDGGDASPIGFVKMRIGKQNAMGGAHGHFSTQNLFVVFSADGDNADTPTDLGNDLQGLFNRVVIRLVDRINQFVTLNIVAGAIERDFVFRVVGYSSNADQDLHL